MTWTEADWNALAALVFRDDYPGFRPGVVEAPVGNPVARDSGKRFAHVASKYVDDWSVYGGEHHDLVRYYVKAWREARRISDVLHMNNTRFAPSMQFGALRVLEYPAGVGASHVHTDISLFTVNLWRSHPNPGLGGRPWHMGRLGELLGLGPAEPHFVAPLSERQCALVYFAIPDHASCIPAAGLSVGEWLERELKTMRYEAGEQK